MTFKKATDPCSKRKKAQKILYKLTKAYWFPTCDLKSNLVFVFVNLNMKNVKTQAHNLVLHLQ